MVELDVAKDVRTFFKEIVSNVQVKDGGLTKASCCRGVSIFKGTKAKLGRPNLIFGAFGAKT